MRRLIPHRDTLHARRSGAALMEVLIAILAMGIGVVSLMSLFPLSVVRTAQAHQLTVGTGLRLNAEAFLETYPRVWIDPDPLGTPPGTGGFLFDPLGIARMNTNTVGSLTRYNDGYTSGTTPSAAEMMVYDGNWETQSDELITQNLANATTITLGTGTNLAGVPSPTGPSPSRIVLYDASGLKSATRRISSIAGTTVNWTDPLTMNTSRARVETKDEQFSWMLTVHRSDTATQYVGDLFVAVFFRRDFSPESEAIVNCVFNAGSTIATATYAAGSRPAIRRNGYVFDSVNGYWYRVSDYSEDLNARTLTMTLEFPAQATSNEAIFFRGLTDVYFLGTKEHAK